MGFEDTADSDYHSGFDAIVQQSDLHEQQLDCPG